MKCPECNYLIPEDSEFCQYCGTKIKTGEECEAHPNEIIPHSGIIMHESSETEKEEMNSINSCSTNSEQLIPRKGQSHNNPPVSAMNSHTPSHSQKYCKKCGSSIDNITKKCSGCGKQYFRAKRTIPFVLLFLLLFASLGWNAMQYALNKENEVTIEELEATVVSKDSLINDQETEITKLESSISTQKTKISVLENRILGMKDRATNYDTICSALSSGNIGYAASNFCSSESVIVVDKDTTDRKFTLTANWYSGGSVSVDYSSHAASARFDSESWYTSTTMTIVPNFEGVSVLTFSNTVDSNTFKVIIIVTDANS